VLGQSEQSTSYLFITHSLGSRILYDVLRNLARVNKYGDGPFRDSDSTAFQAVGSLVCKISGAYMMANQLSLLKLGTIGTSADEIADDPLARGVWYAVRAPNEASPQRPFELSCSPKPLFVAFMDTNDPLSWPIQPRMSYRDFNFLTVFVHNTWWHWLYTDALQAHGGYFENPEVGRLIACGTSGGQLRACTSGRP
jgi:hypothetical protein